MNAELIYTVLWIVAVLLALWVIAVVLLLAFNYSAHQGDPEDRNG